MSEINLSSIIKEKAQVVEEFPGYPGFNITLEYPGRKEFANIRKECTIQKLNRKTHRVEDHLDEDKFLRKYAERVIKGWTGLKLSYLQEIALVDAEGLDPDQEIPFSVDNAVVLLENSPVFDTWITEIVADFGNFTKSR